MTWMLFIVGLLTSLGCGAGMLDYKGHVAGFAIFALSGFGGAGLMILAILLNQGWQP